MWTPTTRLQHSRAGLRYGSDLTDAEWAILHPFLPSEADCGRKRAHPMREIVNAICYVLRGGIAWRLMPDGFPPWRTVYRWFARLRDDGTWETVNHHLVMRDRERVGRMVGYDGWLSIEHEDILLSRIEGARRSVELLRAVAPVEASDYALQDF